MRLSETEILKLLPAWMREDKADQSLAAGTDAVSRAVAARSHLLTRWDKLDQLPEQELDELAWELDIKWYDSTASIEVKRAIIRSSDLVYAKMGTKFAVEQVITDYYGTGGIDEWFDYDGKPNHFRVHVEGAHVGLEGLRKFRRILNIVKRRSSWLDEVVIISPTFHLPTPTTPHLCPRVSVSTLPPPRRGALSVRLRTGPVLGARISTVTLPMASKEGV